MKIHPSAWIEEGARIGADVEIGPNVVIFKHVDIGDRTKIHAGAVIGGEPQDLAFKGVESFVRIGSDCVIREYVTINRGTKEGTSTVMGDGCYLMAYSHLAHNVVIGNKVIIANSVPLAGYVKAGDGVFFGGNAAVHQFVQIGRLAMIAGLSAVAMDVPPFCSTRSATISTIAGLNIVGMKRAGISPGDRTAIRSAFKVLFCSGLNRSQAVDRMKAEFPTGPASELWQFVEKSERGICSFVGGVE